MRTVFDMARERINNQAAQIDAEFRQRRGITVKATHLSDSGKRDELAGIEAKRVAALAALQEQAAGELADARAKHAKKIHDARKEHEEQQRALFGDAVMLARIERQLRRIPARDVVQFVKESASDWQRSIALGFAADILDERQAGGPGNYVLIGDERPHHLEMADGELRGLLFDAKPADLVDLERQGNDLRRGEEWIESLDADAARRRMANVGINYEGALLYADELDRQAQAV